jgi:hypothetical protein
MDNPLDISSTYKKLVRQPQIQASSLLSRKRYAL